MPFSSANTLARALVLAAFLGAIPAQAHHGFRGYDDSKLLAFSGTVEAVHYVNPHVTIDFRPGNPPGEALTVTFPPPWSMTSRGLPESALAPGKQIRLEGYLNRRDRHELLATKIELDAKTVRFRGELADSELSHWMRSDPWAFPVTETLHIIALAIVVGAAAMFDLRLLGLASTIRVSALGAFLLRWSLGAFTVSAATGFLLFLSDPNSYLANKVFLAKLGLLFLAGVNAAVFRLTTYRSVGQWDVDVPAPARAKLTAILSLLLWLAVILAGRLIAFAE